MVGIENSVGGNYYNVSNGKIVKSFGSNETEGATSRVNKVGNTVYEKYFSFIEGNLIDASIKSNEAFGDSIILKLQDEAGELDILQLKFDSSYGRSFLFKIPNLDLSKSMKIVPYSFTNKNGKEITGLNIYNNAKVLSAFSREEPNGLPPLKEITFNGKKQWDKTKQLAFLSEIFVEFVSKFKRNEDF